MSEPDEIGEYEPPAGVDIGFACDRLWAIARQMGPTKMVFNGDTIVADGIKSPQALADEYFAIRRSREARRAVEAAERTRREAEAYAAMLKLEGQDYELSLILADLQVMRFAHSAPLWVLDLLIQRFFEKKHREK